MTDEDKANIASTKYFAIVDFIMTLEALKILTEVQADIIIAGAFYALSPY